MDFRCLRHETIEDVGDSWRVRQKRIELFAVCMLHAGTAGFNALRELPPDGPHLRRRDIHGTVSRRTRSITAQGRSERREADAAGIVLIEDIHGDEHSQQSMQRKLVYRSLKCELAH